MSDRTMKKVLYIISAGVFWMFVAAPFIWLAFGRIE
jgi:hypothetical protein